jgi:hypothetical protein
MSNLVEVKRTKFTNLDGSAETYGYRIYDNYGASYCNLFFKEDELPKDDFELIKYIQEYNDEVVDAMLQYIEDDQEGISIDDEFYEWKDIKHLW